MASRIVIQIVPGFGYPKYSVLTWLDEECGWMGEKQMWLEPQPWALIGGCVPPEKAALLVATIDDLARKPSPIGALLQSQPDPTMKDEPGTGTNGGIFAAIKLCPSVTIMGCSSTCPGNMANKSTAQ